MKTLFGAQVIKPHKSYLDLPSLVGRSKSNTFAHLKQRVENKLLSWKEKLLTSAGKKILIKAVTRVVPSYTMSYFLLPNKLCNDFQRMIRQFWWGQANTKKKLAWLIWEKLCMPKVRRGLGFLELKLFNLALLVKQGGRLQTNTSSLFCQVFRAKYFPHGNFVEADMGRNPSYAWRSLMATQGVVRKAFDGRWGMAKTLEYGVINGCQDRALAWWYFQKNKAHGSLWLRTS